MPYTVLSSGSVFCRQFPLPIITISKAKKVYYFSSTSKVAQTLRVLSTWPQRSPFFTIASTSTHSFPCYLQVVLTTTIPDKLVVQVDSHLFLRANSVHFWVIYTTLC